MELFQSRLLVFEPPFNEVDGGEFNHRGKNESEAHDHPPANNVNDS